MIGTSARLLRLLSMLQSRRFWTGSELASRLEITERTVRRDIDRLRSLGYPVSATSGVAGGYQLGAGATLPPLLLQDDEAMAVSLGLSTAAAGGVTGLEESVLRALAKLEQVLPPRLRRRIKALHTAIVPLHHKTPPVDAEVLTTIAGASRNHEHVELRYTDLRGEVTDRNIEPHGLVHSGSRWYLVAWDVDRRDWRTFRMDRVVAPVKVAGRFVPRPVPHGNVATYVSQSVAANAYPVSARVRLHTPLDVAAQTVSPLAGRLERIDDKTCMLITGAHSLAPLAVHVALLGFDFDVVEPPELIAQLEVLSKRLKRAAASSKHAR